MVTLKNRAEFLGYLPHFAATPYPATLCLSVNDVVVHGIPGRRVLRAGDIVSIDCGAEIGGYHGDAAVTVPVGPVDDDAVRLMDAAEAALAAGMAVAVPGGGWATSRSPSRPPPGRTGCWRATAGTASETPDGGDAA